MKDDRERWRERRRERVLAAYRETGGIKATAKKLAVSIHVVRRVLRGRDGPRAAPRTQAVRPSKLDAYRPVIRRLVVDEHLTAALVLEEIRTLGYVGGHSILREYVRGLRPSSKQKVTTVVEHPPGAEGQVDWSPYRVMLGGEQRVVHAFSLVLPFSRYMVLRFALDE
jgi:transposase